MWPEREGGQGVVPLAPPGWVVRRHSERRWWLFRDQRAVAEFGVLASGEWWACPDGEALPWPTTYPTSAGAVAALTTWWTAHRSSPNVGGGF